MKIPFIIGITGGMGGGKSTFSAHLRKRGKLVYDTDFEAKRLQNTNPEIKSKVIAQFGNEVYNADGLDRVKLAKIVFEDSEKLKILNSIVHPELKKNFHNWALENSDQKFLFMECAILFEGGFDELVDKIVVVTAPEDIRIKRVVKRDNVTEDLVLARIKNQWPDEEKITRADWVFDTDNNSFSCKRVDEFLTTLESSDFD